jgi:4-amino-4-deoxy-L-arabinose transferase-like glycosyltransferase
VIGVSAVDAVTGFWLWKGNRRGKVVGLVTTPVTFGLAVLFQLPLLLVVAPLRALLLIVAPARSIGARQ